MMPCRQLVSPLFSHFPHHVHDFLQRMEANQKKMDEELTFTPRIAGAKTEQKVSHAFHCVLPCHNSLTVRCANPMCFILMYIFLSFNN
jgi:hypothetical protein